MSYAHELARGYNDALWHKDRRRAEEIEWYVNHAGAVALRDIPEASIRRTRGLEQRREADRQRWVREQDTMDRPFAPAEQLDVFA